VRVFHPGEAMVRVTRLRLIEIGVAVMLTMAALLFVAWTAWAAEPESIGVSDAWVRPTIGEGRTTAAYMTVTNAGETDDVLKAVKSPKAARVELHETKMTDEGVMRMRPLVDGLPIVAGGTAVLKPGGMHVMVMGLESGLEDGDALPLKLEFAHAAPVEIVVPVRTGAGGDHAHH